MKRTIIGLGLVAAFALGACVGPERATPQPTPPSTPPSIEATPTTECP
jgi:hypothetical protein